jgi:hypothetical protein
MAADPAGLLSKYWEAVHSYADLCTNDSADTAQLTNEAFARTLNEAPPWTAPHFAWLPRLLVSVRNTAGEWYEAGHGRHLNPSLRAWLDTDDPSFVSTALHGFQDMPEPDKSLLWHSQIELRPLVESAGIMGVSPVRAEAEVQRTRELFRESCLRARLHTLTDDECRGYAKLIDVATRDSDGGKPPEDLRRHLARCFDCSTAVTDFALHGNRLAVTLARGVLGWGSTSYLRLRREAAAAGPQPVSRRAPRAPIPARRAALTLAALTVPALVILAIVLPSSDPGSPAAASSPSDPAAPISLQPQSPLPSPSPSGAQSSSQSPSPRPTAAGFSQAAETVIPADSSPTTSPPAATHSSASSAPKPTCTARYHLVNEWDGGFQAEVVLTSRTALDGWTVGWRFPDGQRLTQMWNGTFTQSGAEVEVTPAGYNRSIPAHQELEIGFLGTWSFSNGSPSGITLNGAACSS